jgi:phosphate acetyltransferase
VDRVREAVSIARAKDPTLMIEGEWQADAALDRFSATMKGVGDSPMAGLANVLVVPTLETGNIAYKLVQRLGGCRAVGPVLYGAAAPAHDLSRGCSADDIVDLMAITSLQVQTLKKQETLTHAH